MKNLQTLAWLEWREHKRRILGSIPVLILISILGFGLSLIKLSGNDFELIARFRETYQQVYPLLFSSEQVMTILCDYRLSVVILTAALVSPFLGILDSISSEKERRTIEGLLVLPLTETDIIGGKMLTCFLAGILLSWLLWIFYIIFLTFYASFMVACHLLSSVWLVLCFLLVPMVALFMNLTGIIIAVRVQRAQTGYNLGLLILFPLVVILTLLGLGAFLITVKNLLIVSLLFILLNGFLFNISYKTFNREKIILKYK